MPGKGGMRPDHNNRSVPVLMPENATSTMMSSGPMAFSANVPTDRSCGPFSTMAVASMFSNTLKRRPASGLLCCCQTILTQKTVNLNLRLYTLATINPVSMGALVRSVRTVP